MDQLTEQWGQWSTKFGARAMRERGLIAVLVVAAVVLMFDTLAVAPLGQQHKQLSTQLQQVRAKIKAGEQAMAAGSNQADPDAVKRRYRDELRKQIAEIDSKLQGLQKQLVPPDQVARLLEGMLSRERGLALVSLRKLPVQQFNAKAVTGKPGAAGAASVQVNRSIYQHSFEIEVEGSYAELYGYLAKLEKLPWQLFWGKAVLNADQHPRLRLTLTVHTLSLNKVWLIV